MTQTPLSRFRSPAGVLVPDATFDLRHLLFVADVSIREGDAAWTLSEAGAVGQVIGNIVRVFGDNATQIVGGVTICRMHVVRYPLVYAGKRCSAFEFLKRVWIGDVAFRTPEAAEHTLTHELGHYLQESKHLLGEFKRARSEDYPNKHAREKGAIEDLAASFEIFVYETIGRPCIENGNPLTLDSSRRDFFLQFVR